MSSRVGNHLIQNQTAPIQGLSQGGAGSTADLSGNAVASLTNMFSPGGNNLGPTRSYNNPLEGKLIPRFEMPDTMDNVNLGDVVVFLMMSNGETFYTDTICPIVQWGWALKRITYGTWVFPQYPVRPTPETAPPRTVESYRLSDTTTLIRYAIGNHMSVEYMNTPMGKDNQRFALKQIALSTQETLNANVINALQNSQYKVAERRERGGIVYGIDAVEEGYKTEIKRFCAVQKTKFGFKTTLEEILTEMQAIGGRATDIIMTKKANSLAITRPELVDYQHAGNLGVARTEDPNRSIVPSGLGLNVHYSQTYKERFGATLGPWEKLVQIGEYFPSKQVNAIDASGEDYYANFTSKIMHVWVYDVYKDKFVEMTLESMIENCMLWDNNGELLEPTVPGNVGIPETEAGDFLMMRPSEMIKGMWDDDPFHSRLSFGSVGKVGGHGALFGKSGSKFGSERPFGRGGGGGRTHGSNYMSIELLGQLALKDFGKDNFTDCGEMLIRRVAKAANMDFQTMMVQLQDGLALFKRMSEEPVDLEFVDYVVSDAIATMFKAENNNYIVDDTVKNPLTGPTLVVTNTPEQIWNMVTKSVLVQTKDSNEEGTPMYRFLKNVRTGNECLPLPVTSNQLSPLDSRHWPHLTGYASYAGFVAMSAIYSSVSSRVDQQLRYNIKQIETAHKFVTIIKAFVATINTILPNCTLFLPKDNDLIKARTIAEKVFNMVGLPIWVDLRNSSTFITSDVIKTGRAQGKKYQGGVADGVLTFLDSQAGVDWYQRFNFSALARHAGSLPNEVSQKLITFLKACNTKGKSKGFAAFKLPKLIIPSKDVTLDRFKNLIVSWTKPAIPIEPSKSAPKNAFFDEIKDIVTKDTNAEKVETVVTELVVGGTSSIINPRGGSFLLGSSEFRIEAYKTVWWILEHATTHIDDLGQMLALLEDIGLIMFNEDIIQNCKVYPYTNLEDGLKQIRIIHNLNTSNPKAPLTEQEYIVVLTNIWTKYFSSVLKNYDDLAAQMKSRLIFAEKKTVDFSKAWNSATANTGLHLPTLTGLKNNLFQSDGVLKFTTAPNNVVAKDLLEFIIENGIDQQLGVSAESVALGHDTHGFMSIGPKHKESRKIREEEKLEKEATGGDFIPEIDAMIKTSLMLSAEQVQSIYLQGIYGKFRPNGFNFRITSPSNGTTYVPITELRKLHNEIDRLEQVDTGYENVHWREIPLLSAEKKLRTTAFSGGVRRAYGIPVEHLNNSFFQVCKLLDREGSTYQISKAATILIMMATFSKKSLIALAKGNIKIPIYFHLIRPHMTFTTESCAILSVGTDALGFTALAGKDYITGQTVKTKEWDGHVSFWSAVIILHPENCYILAHAMMSAVGSGCGTLYYDNPRTYNPIKNDFKKEFVENFPSLFCIAIPFGEEPLKEMYIATTGKIPQLTRQTASSAIKVSAATRGYVHYSTADRYNRIWGFDRAQKIRMPGFLQFMGSSGQAPIYNTMCFKGCAKYWNPTKKEPLFVSCGEGHLGNVGTGCRAVFQGEVVEFPEFHYNTDPSYTVV